jgi:ATP-binding cassette subfamily F protein uup
MQQRLEADGGWEIEQRAERVISRLGLDADLRYATLSGGLRGASCWPARWSSEPDLLLLDEPTNHLDIETIEWLEDFLLGFVGSLLFITHDRRFLRRLATRILELDRGRLTDWPGDYDNYPAPTRRARQRRGQGARALRQEAGRGGGLDPPGHQGPAHPQRGPGARLKAMREERLERRERPARRAPAGQRRAQRQARDRGRGRRLRLGRDAIIRGLDTLILRGDRVGIVGPNGAGKSTLLKLLLGELQPDSGASASAPTCQVAYFDQLRAQLDPARACATTSPAAATGRDRRRRSMCCPT